MATSACPLCFEANPAGSDFCEACGAPLREGAVSDDAVYREIAEANLLRVRQDFKGAADRCLAVLRRYPNNATVHVLLADVYAEQGAWTDAAQWYEMALDLQDDDAVRRKLDDVRNRVASAETSETLAKIGVPERKPMVWGYVLAVGLLVVAVAGGAFLAGQGSRGGQRAMTSMGDPIDVSGVAPRLLNPPEPTTETPVPAGPAPARDSLLQAIESETRGAPVVLRAVFNPRERVVTVVAQAETAVQPRVTAAKAALAALAASAEAVTATVLVEGEGGRVVFAADLSAEAARTARAALAGGDTVESQAEVILSGVWVPGSVPSEGTAPQTSPPGEEPNPPSPG